MIQTDATHGKVANLAGSGAAITSSAFAVGADAQAFTFDVGYGSVSNSGMKVYALTGPTFATSTLLDTFLCSTCNRWDTATVAAIAYRGQTIKLKFERYLNDSSLDGPAAPRAAERLGTERRVHARDRGRRQ